MLGVFFTPLLENWKGIKRVSGVGQGFTEYFKLSARGSKPFWLVYINSYYSLIIIMQFICNLICNIIQFLTGQAVLKKRRQCHLHYETKFHSQKMIQQPLKKSDFSYTDNLWKSSLKQVILESFIQFGFLALLLCEKKIAFLYRSI